MNTSYRVDFDERPNLARIDYVTWLGRLSGWDALFPLIVGLGAAGVAWAFGREGSLDVLALVPLPVLGFLVRLCVGLHQIGQNACGRVMRWLQGIVLVVGLFIVMFLDFFVALGAFNPNHAIGADEIGTVLATGSLIYLPMATFAMYPGRCPRASDSPHSAQARAEVAPQDA